MSSGVLTEPKLIGREVITALIISIDSVLPSGRLTSKWMPFLISAAEGKLYFPELIKFELFCEFGKSKVSESPYRSKK